MKNACKIFSLSVSKSWETGNTGIFTKKPGYMPPPAKASGYGIRVFNGISFREIFAKRKRNEFRNFAEKRSFSRNFVFRENVILAKISEAKRSETKRNKRNKRNETQ